MGIKVKWEISYQTTNMKMFEWNHYCWCLSYESVFAATSNLLGIHQDEEIINIRVRRIDRHG